LAYILIIGVYLSVLLVVDTQKGFFEYILTSVSQLPDLMLFALASFGLRYARWFYLLHLASNKVPAWRGWLAYLSGFAFTATPGKVGELVRIRYFGRLDVSGHRVMSAFVFERALDLIVVFCLAVLWVVDNQMFIVTATFVITFMVVVGVFMFKPKLLEVMSIYFLGKGCVRVGRFLFFLSQAMAGCAIWLRPVPLFLSLLLGFGAWSITALAFVYLLNSSNLHLPILAVFAAYPLAMLAGAASMLPGGVGSTEAVIVLQLQWHGVPAAHALSFAVLIRLATIWFSIVCGFVSILILEMQFKNSSSTVVK
jgi:uncharacterized protein (TIRG00374 family)